MKNIQELIESYNFERELLEYKKRSIINSIGDSIKDIIPFNPYQDSILLWDLCLELRFHGELSDNQINELESEFGLKLQQKTDILYVFRTDIIQRIKDE